MENLIAFGKAALPWVAMGVLVIILCVRGARKTGEKNYGTEGMCLGMCLGTAIGTAFGGDTGLGLSLGMLIGLAIGTGVPKNKKDTT